MGSELAPASPRPLVDLEAGAGALSAAPRDVGFVRMIVRRPQPGEREVLDAGELDPQRGLVGDRWFGSTSRDPARQLTLISARVLALIAPEQKSWPLSGDQLVVDFDLSTANVPPGTRLEIGTAVVEASVEPHTGCRKFRARYGLDALRFIGALERRDLQLRGINTRIVTGGVVRPGDRIRKL